MCGIYAIIQARTGARRLPGKVLFDLEGKTVLERVVERVRKSVLIDEVIVATTILEEDLKIVRLCAERGIRVYCGSSSDVLDRYFHAARLIEAEHIVRVCCDCPLIDPKVIDRVIKLHLKEKADYTSNNLKESFPDGLDTEVVTFDALKKAWQDARLSSEREHVTPYIKNHPEIFRIKNLASNKDFSSKRWTLDEKEDYKLIRLIYNKLCKKNRLFNMQDVLKFLKAHPEYEIINNHVRRNEGYLKSLREDRILNLDDIK